MLIPFLFILIAIVLIVGSARRGSIAVRAALAALVMLWVLATPLAASSLVRVFGVSRPLADRDLVGARAIVVPGGGLRRNALEYRGPQLGRLTLDRVRYAASLSRRTGLPLLVSGGRYPETEATEAGLMAAMATNELGATVRWLEDTSANTRGNAERSAMMLAPEGIRRIVLVVHAFDMPRAAREFRSVGFEVIPAPIGLDFQEGDRWQHYVPSLDAIERLNFVMYELLATARNWFRAPPAVPRWPEEPKTATRESPLLPRYSPKG